MTLYEKSNSQLLNKDRAEKVNSLMNQQEPKISNEIFKPNSEGRKPKLSAKEAPIIHDDVTTYRRQSKHTERKTLGRLVDCLMALLVVTFVMTLILTVAVIVTATATQETEAPSKEHQRMFPQEICVQCIKLLKNPFNQQSPDPLVDMLVKRVDDGILMCCAEDNEHFSALLEAIIREQDAKTIPVLKTFDSKIKFAPALAHKQLLPNNELKLNSSGQWFYNASTHFMVRFNKDYDDILTEQVRGITVLKTALEVQHSGTYYIYLGVHVAPMLNKYSHLFQDQNWIQSVHRDNPNNPANNMILFHMSHTACRDCSQHEETAFMGGTFYLEKGDHISVCLGGLGLVQYKKESSFIGMFMLSSGKVSSKTRF